MYYVQNSPITFYKTQYKQLLGVSNTRQTNIKKCYRSLYVQYTLLMTYFCSHLPYIVLLTLDLEKTLHPSKKSSHT